MFIPEKNFGKFFWKIQKSKIFGGEILKKYLTKSGESFDSICYKFFGDKIFLTELMKANPKFLDVFIFSAGTEILIPDVSRKTKLKIPPWKK